MRVIHATHQDQGEINSGISDWLEVRRGRTQFPHRPLIASRCLIGSGSNCHLQLGGEVPMLHSLLVLQEGQWTLEVVAPEPTLFVNGEACRHRALSVGDRIQLAEFEFALCRGEKGVPKPDRRRPHHQAFMVQSLREETAGLTASELLERLESELSAIELYEQGRQQGAMALLDAARRQSGSQKGSDSAPQHRRRVA